MHEFHTSVDFQNHVLKNTRLELFSSNPALPLEGRIWHNSDEKIPYIRANSLDLPLVAKDDNFHNGALITTNEGSDELLVWDSSATPSYQFDKYRRITFNNFKAQFGTASNAFKTLNANSGLAITATGEDTFSIHGDNVILATRNVPAEKRMYLDFKTQVQKRFLAGPSAGVDAAPTFRQLLLSDLPAGITIDWTNVINKPLTFPPSFHTHPYEPELGNPSVDGYVLSSTIAGVRSWVLMSGGPSYTFQYSLVEAAGVVNLVNDSASPGNSKYYGTNGSGTRGFYDIPSSMVYPGAGIAFSSGSGWGTSIVGTNNRFPIFTAAGIANSNFSQDANKIVNTVNNSAIEFHALGFYFTHNTTNQFVIGSGGTNLLFLTDLTNIVFSKGIRIYSGQTFSAEDSVLSHGKHTVITGGNVSGSGNYNGGNIQFLRGTGVGSGVLGNIYFGDAFTLLPAKSSETNVIYYDTTDGKISYGTVSAGTTYTFQHSLTETTGTVNLVNDTASPGNSKLYGTNGSGTRGWHDIPAAGVTPVDGIWDWDTNAYKPYTSKQGSLHHFYAGTTPPDNTTRLNLDGQLWATALYDGVSRVITQATLPTGTIYENTLFTNVTMTSAGTYYTAAQLSSLPAGRYLVTGNIVCTRSTTTITIYTGRLRLITTGNTAYPAQSQAQYPSASHLVNMSISAIINIHTTSDLYLDVTANTSSNTIIAAPSYSAQATGQLNYIRVVKLSDYITPLGTSSVFGFTYPVGGGTQYANIGFNTMWYVSSKPSWITLTPSSSGITERITAVASNNVTGLVREGDIVLKSKDNNATVTISCYQNGG